MKFEPISFSENLDLALGIFQESMKSEYYKTKYKDIKTPANYDEWLKVPLLSKKEILNNSYPKTLSMVTKPVEDMIVTSTGGSTGVARYTLYTHEEWELYCETQAKALSLMGIEKSDKVANLFVAGHLWPSFLGVHEIIKQLGAVHLPISANIPQEHIFEICEEFQPNVLLSLPTLFEFLAMYAKKSNVKFDNIKLIAYAGEQMSKQAREQINIYLKPDKIRSLAYSSSDAGLLGYQCDHCKSYEYHIPTGFQFIEFINTDTGLPVGPGEEGEVVVTNLGRKAMPLVRYLIGDIGYLKKEKCICGDENPVFALKGRSGEDFKIGGAFISMEVFEEAIAKYSEHLSSNYQVELEDIGNQMDIRLKIESIDTGKAKIVKENLRNDLIKIIPEFEKGLELDYIRNFDIIIFELGKLERNVRTGKIIRLNDKRHN